MWKLVKKWRPLPPPIGLTWVFPHGASFEQTAKWHTHNKRLISQRSPAYPRLYHIPNKNIDPELSFKRNFSFSIFFRFFRLSPELEYANEIIAKLGILSHTLEMCEKSPAFELFHSFWSFINILWGLVHKECDFDEKTRCGKNRPFFINFFQKALQFDFEKSSRSENTT